MAGLETLRSLPALTDHITRRAGFADASPKSAIADFV